MWVDLYYRQIVWRKSSRCKDLYLTFDDGPDSKSTHALIALLKPFDVKATFFCLGTQVQSNMELCKDLLREGHMIANHNLNHDNGWKTNTNEYLAGVEKCQCILGRHHLTQRRLYRPPYGKICLLYTSPSPRDA